MRIPYGIKTNLDLRSKPEKALDWFNDFIDNHSLWVTVPVSFLLAILWLILIVLALPIRILRFIFLSSGGHR